MHAAPSRSTNPFDDDENGSNNNDSDDEYSDEAIARILGEMDIDADFNCWTSFRASMSITTSSSVASPARSADLGSIGEGEAEDDADQLTESEQAYIDKWSRRVGREEVYSKYYHPVPREAREVQSLAAFLGLAEGSGGFLNKLSSNLVRMWIKLGVRAIYLQTLACNSTTFLYNSIHTHGSLTLHVETRANFRRR
mmetsp:Transcript_37060/g.75520  ORF Transcript_37060/g.75520 Transcript_37060/m.75520 type:complete len:196 (-) Transcript_37060:2330-2917(-)